MIAVDWDTAPYLLVYHYGLSRSGAVCQGFTVYLDSFLSSHGEKHHNPKSGQEVDPDKPGCTMSCQGGETSPYFCMFFWIFVPDPDSSSQI